MNTELKTLPMDDLIDMADGNPPSPPSFIHRLFHFFFGWMFEKDDFTESAEDLMDEQLSRLVTRSPKPNVRPGNQTPHHLRLTIENDKKADQVVSKLLGKTDVLWNEKLKQPQPPKPNTRKG